MYNCGDKIFNEYLYIMPNPQAQTIDTSSKTFTKKVFGLKSIYQEHYNIDLETADTKHSAYVTYANSDYTPTSNDYIFNHEDKSYIKKDYRVTIWFKKIYFGANKVTLVLRPVRLLASSEKEYDLDCIVYQGVNLVDE